MKTHDIQPKLLWFQYAYLCKPFHKEKVQFINSSEVNEGATRLGDAL
jgi:hypothetical protein